MGLIFPPFHIISFIVKLTEVQESWCCDIIVEIPIMGHGVNEEGARFSLEGPVPIRA